MQRIVLPEVGQIGVVVRDVEKAIEYYSKFGLGPFQVVEIAGEVGSKMVKAKLAFAQMGQVQLELIEIVEGETIHTEFLKKRGEGLHHLGFFVEDLEKEVDRWKKQGVGVLQAIEGFFAYMDTAKIGGVILELISARQIELISARQKPETGQ